MTDTVITAANIKAAQPLPNESGVFRTDSASEVRFELDPDDRYVLRLHTDDWYSLKDLKQLRKFLKAAEAQIRAEIARNQTVTPEE